MHVVFKRYYWLILTGENWELGNICVDLSFGFVAQSRGYNLYFYDMTAQEEVK